MRKKVMLEEVISVVKLSLFPVWCWPLPRDATPFKVLCMKLHHCLSIIIEIVLASSNVTFEMVHFSGLMKPHEEIVVQRHIDKCVVYHGGSIIIYYMVTFLTITLPFVTQQSFPTLVEYPFDVSHEPLKTITYIHQSAAVIIVAGQLCINPFMALLLWFATARFEILTEELGKVTNAYQLFKCIKEHQELLKYVSQSLSCTKII
ncbi:uncharacterized protein [Temnothorax nylanderi]|uniref:uncharacterized protein n=1 Tax=Temnothorax nylanderi TaxID=102681 RepID=UPI003A870E08